MENLTIYNDVIQGSDKWHELRKGSVGASSSKKVHSSTFKKYAFELVAATESTQVKDNFVSEAMERGTNLEPYAVREFESRTGKEVSTTGLIQNKLWKGCHVSPDGLIYKDGIITEAIETKCPNSETHIGYLFEGKLPNEYKEQIWHTFTLIPTLEKMFFVSFDPRVEKNQMFILELKREDIQKDIEKHEAALSKFLKVVNLVKEKLNDSF